MASWTDRIQGLTGLTLGTAPAPSTNEALEFISDAIRETRVRLMRAVPQDMPQFTKNATLADANGHDMEEALVVISVTREDGTNTNFIPCTEVPYEMSYKVTDEDSLWFRSKHNPCYYWDGTKIYVKPVPSAGGVNDAIITYIPSTVTQGGSAIIIGTDINATDYFPDKYIHLAVWHASAQVLTATMNDIHNKVNSMITTDVVVPDVPDIIYNDVNMPTLPSYNAPPMIIDYPGVESYFNVEDIELVTPAISKVTQQISEFNALSKDEHQRVQTELKEYDNELQRRMKDAEGSLQGDIAQYQRRIEKYQQDIAKFGADLQAWTARYQWYAERYQSIVQQYLAFFGHMTPKQEQAKSQERKEG